MGTQPVGVTHQSNTVTLSQSCRFKAPAVRITSIVLMGRQRPR